MKKLVIALGIVSGFWAGSSLAQTPSSNQNYVVETILKVKGRKTVASLSGLPVDSVNKTIQYFDGFGRPVQTVQWQGSPTKKDVVQPIIYDNYGRESQKYNPYAEQSSADASYKSAALINQSNFYSSTAGWDAAVAKTTYPFSKTVFEASPLNRPLEQGAPGVVWQPGSSRTTSAGRTVVMGYGTNNTSTSYTSTGFAVRLYKANIVAGTGNAHKRTLSGTGYYAAGELYLSITKDENWVSTDVKAGTVEEYKDKEGRVVLKRVFNKTSTGTIQTVSTFYVYDDLGNLSYVLPPELNPDAAAVPTQVNLDKIAYQYRYDGEGRLIEKKLPATAGWEHLIYNKLDQLVMTQDTLQRITNKWRFFKYDAFGRQIIDGIITNSSTRVAMQGIVDASTVLWEGRSIGSANGTGYTNNAKPDASSPEFNVISYYDDYDIQSIPDNQSAAYSKLINGLPTAIKTRVLGTSTFLWGVNYYNDKGLLVKVWKQHYKGGSLATGNFDEVINTYNFEGAVTTTTRKHYLAGVESVHIENEFKYDHAGRKTDTYQKTSNATSTSSNAKILLTRNVYNEIGQLKTKRYHSTNSGTSFAETVTYGYNQRGWLLSQTAANLAFNQVLKYDQPPAGVTPQYNGNISRQEWGAKYYNYSYDVMNRLTAAKSSGGNDELLSYSTMGNIDWLQRKFNTALIDQLRYTRDGHRLTNVVDSNTNVADDRFQLHGTTNYTYDANGNMLSRLNTNTTPGPYLVNNLSGIGYNHLNLPVSMNHNGTTLTYTYAADGTKLRKQYGASSNNDYISGIQYQNGALDFAQTEVGRVIRNGTGLDPVYLYEYTLSDHLGNGRVYFDIFSGAARKIQETEYYAFGLPINVGSVVGTENKYQYNGKERQGETKMFDYGARFYDPVIARWNVVDPMAEKYFSYSPYNYVANNPLALIDPNGMDIEAISGGVKFTGQDAENAWDLFTKRKKNVYMAIERDAERRANIDRMRNGKGNGKWAVFGAENFELASKALSVFNNRSLDNLVLETHGGYSDIGGSFLRINDMSDIHPNFQRSNNYLTAENIGDHVGGKSDPDAQSLKDMASKVKNKGNFILAACIGDNPDRGQFATNVAKLTGNRLNIYYPKGFVNAGVALSGPWIGVRSVDRLLRVTHDLGWIGIFPNGRTANYKTVEIFETKFPSAIIK